MPAPDSHIVFNVWFNIINFNCVTQHIFEDCMEAGDEFGR